MQMLKILSVLLVTLMLGACSLGNRNDIVGGQITVEHTAGISAVAGSSLTGISYSYSAEELVVSFATVVGAGQFVELQLPEGLAPVGQHWLGNEGTISLMLHGSGIIQLGVAPLAGYQGNPITVTIPLGPKPHNVAEVPVGDENQLVDLTLASQGDGNSKLEWSEVNRGDYDFNGEVNVADITPIAKNHGNTYELDNTDLTDYWVDGDQNGEISVADITPIVTHFQNSIASYRVIAPDGTAVLSPRESSVKRPGLPNKYGVILPGSVTETWQVLPIGTDGAEGEPSEPLIPDPDLLLDVHISGIDLFSLDGSGSFGPAGDGKLMSYLVEIEPLRRLLPGEDPDMAEIGTALNRTTPSVELYDLPHDRYLALLVLFIPTVDLVTGLPRELGNVPGLEIWDYDPVVSIVPINLGGIAPNSQAGVELHLVPGEFDGYISNIATSGHALQPGLVRLDNADGFLIRDSNGNGNFEDDARMQDEARWGVTRARLDQLGQLEEYADGEQLPVVLTAIVNSYNQDFGELALKETLVEFEGDGQPVDLGEIILFVSEYSTFASKLFGEVEETPIDPGLLEFGIEVEILGYKLVDELGGLEAVFWGEHVVKVIR